MTRTAKRDYTREQQLARGPIDLPYLGLTLLLLGIGLIMLLSASSYSASVEATPSHYDAAYYFKRQGIFALGGVVIMYLVSRVDYHLLRRFSSAILILALALLTAVLVPGVGVSSHQATRWLQIGPIQFQPSEIAKLGVVLFFSAKLCDRDQTPKKLKGRYREPIQSLRKFYYWSDLNDLWPLVLILGIIAVLMIKEPHLSGTILIFAAAGAIFFAAGVRLFWFVLGICGGAFGVWFLLVIVGYNGDRIQTWMDPWWDASDKGYQIVQSLYAVASGGLSGLGLGQSRQKYLYLPEEQNDFIFAIVCEELGFIGAALIIALFALLIIRGYWLAIHARDRFGALVIVGINTLLAVQVFLNIAVVTNLIPCTGVSLPFFSYGGTALVIQLVEIGIILSVSRQIPAPAQE
jgi:cell division protein FtsW